MIMEQDNIYTGKKKFGISHNIYYDLFKKNRYHHSEIKIGKYKSLLQQLNSIKNVLPSDRESDRESYITILMNNNYRSKITKIIEKFQKEYKNTWIYILYPDKDIDQFKTSNMSFPTNILFLFKQNNTNVSSDEWLKKEFYFLEFDKVPEEFTNYFHEKEKSSSSKEKEKSSSSKEKEKSSSSKEKEKSSSSKEKEKSSSSKEKEKSSSSKEKEKSSSSSKEKEKSSSSKEKEKSSSSKEKEKSSSSKEKEKEKSSSSKEKEKEKSSSSKEKEKSSSSSKEKDYHKKLVKDLISLCRERGITLTSYKKEYIIERLKEFDTNPNMKLKKKKTKFDTLRKIFKKKNKITI